MKKFSIVILVLALVTMFSSTAFAMETAEAFVSDAPYRAYFFSKGNIIGIDFSEQYKQTITIIETEGWTFVVRGTHEFDFLYGIPAVGGQYNPATHEIHFDMYDVGVEEYFDLPQDINFLVGTMISLWQHE